MIENSEGKPPKEDNTEENEYFKLAEDSSEPVQERREISRDREARQPRIAREDRTQDFPSRDNRGERI